MKRLFSLLACLVVLPVMAEDWKKKDPDTRSQENLKAAKEMRNDAKSMEEMAESLEGKEARAVKKYVEATSKEAEWLEKSSVAYGKNQLRLAERYERKAAEYCSKRGEMLKDMEGIRKKLKGNPGLSAKGKSDKSVDQEAATKAEKLARIEREQAALEEEKTKLLQGSSR